MAKLVYRERPGRKFVELEDIRDGDTLTDIQALIVTLQDMDVSVEAIGMAIRDAAP